MSFILDDAKLAEFSTQKKQFWMKACEIIYWGGVQNILWPLQIYAPVYRVAKTLFSNE